jgi:SAM-dependent methyltransferase
MEDIVHKSSKSFLQTKLSLEILYYFHNIDLNGEKIINELAERWSNDKIFSEKQRFETIKNELQLGQKARILDMAAGCGSFVIQGLLNGYNVQGIEPEDWKHELIDIKFQENQYNSNWRSRIIKGFGEKLPFDNESFDHIDSWQTFEHVTSVIDCLSEIRRVLVTDGTAIIRCPNYLSFYEGHYRSFWIPLMGDSLLGRIYVKYIIRRPIAGLKTFKPISTRALVKSAKNAGFKVRNLEKEEIIKIFGKKFPILNNRRFKLISNIGYNLWKFKKRLFDFGKREQGIHLLLEK